MSWEDQGRQYHEWFGHGTAPVKLKPIVDKASSTEDSLDERLQSLVHGAIGALAKRLRRQAETQLQAGTLGRLTEAMAAWVHGSKMDAASFARHFFGRAADDPVVGSLRAAVSEAVEATTRPQLAAASGDLAKAMTAVGLDGWPRFVADAQARARERRRSRRSRRACNRLISARTRSSRSIRSKPRWWLVRRLSRAASQASQFLSFN